MKKLYWVSLIILLLLSSCQSTDKMVAETILKAQDASSITDAISVYENVINQNPKTDYNLAFLYYQNAEYDKAINICQNYTTLNFLLIKVESYKLLENNELFISTINELLILDPAYIAYREELISELVKMGLEDEAKKEAEILLTYDAKNQVAITELAKYSDYFDSLLVKEEEIIVSEEVIDVLNDVVEENPIESPLDNNEESEIDSDVEFTPLDPGPLT